VLPLLILLTFLVVDFARAFMVKSVVEQSAREGARVLAANEGETLENIEAMVTAVAQTSGITPTSVSLDRYYLGSQVQATVSAEMNWLYPGLLKLLGFSGSNSVTLQGVCTMRREYDL
jgi:Flp pilus assembly protein TadG